MLLEEEVSTNIEMVNSTLESGKTTRSMDKEFTNSLMEESTLEPTMMTGRTALVSTFMAMAEHTWETGQVADKTMIEFSSFLMELQSKEFGKEMTKKQSPSLIVKKKTRKDISKYMMKH